MYDTNPILVQYTLPYPDLYFDVLVLLHVVLMTSHMSQGPVDRYRFREIYKYHKMSETSLHKLRQARFIEELYYVYR
jgi:hypothetical protein